MLMKKPKIKYISYLEPFKLSRLIWINHIFVRQLQSLNDVMHLSKLSPLLSHCILFLERKLRRINFYLEVDRSIHQL